MGFSRKVGSIKNLKDTLKGGSGGGPSNIQWIPANGSLLVRFLTEPDEWANYIEHYDSAIKRYFPCTGEPSCPGCVMQSKTMNDSTPSSRYLANALDVEKDKVVAVKIPKDLFTRLFSRYEKYDTLVDRDYELSRTGAGLETEYDYSPEDKVARKLVKYQLLDLEDILQAEYDSLFGSQNGAADDDDEEEDDDEPPAKPAARTRKTAAATKAPAKRAPKLKQPVDEDEEEEEEEEPPAAKAPARRGRKAAAPPVEEEEEEDEEEEEEDDDEGDDEEEDYYTEEELKAMAIGELRVIAKDYDIKVTPKMGKAALIEAILGTDEEPF